MRGREGGRDFSAVGLDVQLGSSLRPRGKICDCPNFLHHHIGKRHLLEPFFPKCPKKY
jgi:hypothetical protein